MGNVQDVEFKEQDVVDWANRSEKELHRKDGAYREYRRLVLQRDAVCGFRFDPDKQEACLDMQMRVIAAQWEAAAKTEGLSVIVDLLERK